MLAWILFVNVAAQKRTVCLECIVMCLLLLTRLNKGKYNTQTKSQEILICFTKGKWNLSRHAIGKERRAQQNDGEKSASRKPWDNLNCLNYNSRSSLGKRFKSMKWQWFQTSHDRVLHFGLWKLKLCLKLVFCKPKFQED